MKSILKKRQILVYIIQALVISGICGGMLYDLGSKMSIPLYYFLLIFVFAYPFFLIYSFLCIPKIELTKEQVTSSSFRSSKTIDFSNVKETQRSKFRNKVYLIGNHYSITSHRGEVIDIPYKFYKNEEELLKELDSKTKR